MNRHSSYTAPRSSRATGTYDSRRGKSSKRNTYDKRSWRDNRFLSNLVFYILPFLVVNLILFFAITSAPKVHLTL